MLATLRKAIPVPRTTVLPAVSAWIAPIVTISAFFWLLAADAIRPIVIYLLELYLVF